MTHNLTIQVGCGAGEFFFHHVTLGWVYPAHDRKTQLPIFHWRFCPFCNGQLPELVDIVTRVVAKPPFDEDDGE